MSIVDLVIKLYGGLRFRNEKIPFWILTPFRMLLRLFARVIFPKYLKKSSHHFKIQTEIIVSLTSFPERIEDVWQVVKCLFRQTYKPRKILLWLSKEQFPTKNLLPASLTALVNDVFEIRFVEGDIRSHKKHYYVSKEYPNSLVLLVDDDIYYPADMIERLLFAYKQNPNAIICQYGSIIRFDRKGKILPYAEWERVTQQSKDKQLFFGSGGGTLFVPSKLYADFTNMEVFMELTPWADDVWINAMVRLARLPIMMLKPRVLLPIVGKGQKITLCAENVGRGKNDIQIAALSKYYCKRLGEDPYRESYIPDK